MKKLLCVAPALLLLAMIGAPNARADSYTPTFSCEGPSDRPFFTCPGLAPPSAPPVSFPAPTIDVSLVSYPPGFDITLSSVDSPTDIYTWIFPTGGPICLDSQPCEGLGTFVIEDQTTGLSESITIQGPLINPDPSIAYGGGLTFSPVSAAAPEPAPILLMLLGAGLIFFMRKRFIMRIPRTA